MNKAVDGAREAAEALAVQALNFLATDPERLSRFLGVTGLDPASIRQAAGESGFLAGVLAYLSGDEALLVAFAAEAGIKPGAVDRAHHLLAGADWERDVP